jgi:hypothetical protein
MAGAMNLTRIRTVAATAATKAMAVAQRVLNVVMRLNPIGLVITAIALLVGGLILAYKKSDTFRAIVDKAFKVVVASAKVMWAGIRSAFNAIVGLFSALASRGTRNLGTIRNAFSSLVSFVRSVPGRFRSAFSTVYNAITTPIRNAVNAVRSWLQGLLDFAKSIPSRIGNAIGGAIPGFAHGGVVGQAASGGNRSGLTMTSENGPELLHLPPGTRVRSNPDTRRMMSGGGGGDSTITLIIQGTGVLEGLREIIRVKGGNVQTVLGK